MIKIGMLTDMIGENLSGHYSIAPLPLHDCIPSITKQRTTARANNRTHKR